MRLELELGKQAPKEQKKNKPFTNPMLCSAMLCSKRSPQGTKEEQTISVQFRENGIWKLAAPKLQGSNASIPFGG